MPWRERLIEAVRRSGRKQSAIARDAGIDPATLSHILRGDHPSTGFQTIARIAYTAGVSIGWLLEEEGFELSPSEIGEVEHAIAFLRDAIDRAGAGEESAWRLMIQRMRREEYRERIAKLRSMLGVIRDGRLEVAASSGVSAMLYLRTADDKGYCIGHAPVEVARAITESVNLVLDLSAPDGAESAARFRRR